MQAEAGQTFDYSDIGGAIGISAPTVQSWISILQAAYIVFLLPSYHGNLKKRLIKSPKIYFYDTGLLCYLLGIFEKEQLERDPLRGHFENLKILLLLKFINKTYIKTFMLGYIFIEIAIKMKLI